MSQFILKIFYTCFFLCVIAGAIYGIYLAWKPDIFPVKTATHSYIPLSNRIRKKVVADLKVIQDDYINLGVKIFLDAESGSSNRKQLETDLVDIFAAAGWDVKWSGNSIIMREPGGPPIHMLLNKANITLGEQLSVALKRFINAEIPLVQSDTFQKDAVEIFLKGEPLFYSNGVVTFR